MKILTIGNGFIASHLSYPIVLDRLRPNHQSVNDFLDKHTPDVIINCIGWCGGKNIDGCELNKQKTFYINTILPIIMGMACEKRDVGFINIGSGCIYQGLSPNHIKYEWSDNLTTGQPYKPYVHDSGWKESDIPTPPSTYSRSKYAADLALETFKNVTTLRIRMPISPKAEPRNLLSKLIGYKEVVEIPNSITFVNELSRAVDFVIDKGLTGTYHVTSPKPITHSRILTEYQKYIPEHQFTSITPKQLDGIVAAPRSNCILNSSKIMDAGFVFQNQDEALEECVREFAFNMKNK